MARLQGAAGTGPIADLTGPVADLIRERRGGELQPLDEMLLLSPPVAEGWSVLLGAIRGRMELDGRLRELVILRIAVLNDASYEWQAHEPHARRCGVSDAEIEAVRHGPAHPVFGPAERAVLTYADTMTREVAVGAEVFAAVAALLRPRELMELTATVACYNMVSRFLVALQVSMADGARPGDDAR
jgi:4-carboxymuconolactone decarboxylase